MAVVSACLTALHLDAETEISKEQVGRTNTNNIRKAMWMCLDKWATSGDFSAYFSEPKLLNRFLCKPGRQWLNFSV